MSRQVTFRFPFEGRPVPVPRIGLFCYSPETYLKLVGLSIHRAFGEHGLGNQYRRLARMMAQGQPREERVARVFDEIFGAFHVAGDAPPFIHDLKLAAHGCAEARPRVDTRPLIEALFLGLGLEPSDWQRRHSYLVVLERAGQHAQQMIEAGDMSAAADFVADHPLLGALVWPGALEALRGAPDLKATGPLTAAMSLDAHLGWLAAWDLDDSEHRGLVAPQFACLLPSRSQPGRNPASRLFDELQRRMDVSSVSAMLDSRRVVPDDEDENDVDIGTLYRWSSGSHFPDPETMEALMKAHGLLDPQDILYRQFGAAKLINLLGYLGQRLSTITRENGEPPAMWPWPNYPFNHADFESWVAARYPDWLDFHRKNSVVLAGLARTTQGASSQ